MSLINQSLFGFMARPAAPLVFAGPPRVRLRAAARLRAWQVLAWLRRRGPRRGDNRPPNDDDPARPSHWDDPELWILIGMMH